MLLKLLFLFCKYPAFSHFCDDIALIHINRNSILNHKRVRNGVWGFGCDSIQWRNRSNSRCTETVIEWSRCVTSGSEQGVWSIGHVVGSRLSDLKYSLTSCRFLNQDFCMMLMDKCFHVTEFLVFLHYSVFLVHLTFLFSGGILVLLVFKNEVFAGSTLHGVIYF